MRRPSLFWAQLIFLGLLALAGLGAAGWAALADLPALPREYVIVIPKGASVTGLPPFPAHISLTLGLQDVLLLRNEDDHPQVIGLIPIGAEQSLRIPFGRVQEVQLACSFHPSGRLTISVLPKPERRLARLWWRLQRLRGLLLD